MTSGILLPVCHQVLGVYLAGRTSFFIFHQIIFLLKTSIQVLEGVFLDMEGIADLTWSTSGRLA